MKIHTVIQESCDSKSTITESLKHTYQLELEGHRTCHMHDDIF